MGVGYSSKICSIIPNYILVIKEFIMDAYKMLQITFAKELEGYEYND